MELPLVEMARRTSPYRAFITVRSRQHVERLRALEALPDGEVGELVFVHIADDPHCINVRDREEVRGVVERLHAVIPVRRFADRHVRTCAVVALVDRNDSVRGEPVDRGDHRRRDEMAVGERQEVEPVVDDVKLPSVLEYRSDVQTFGDLGVDRRILRPAGRGGCVQGRRGDRVRGGEQRHLMARSDQALGEQRGELLPRPVVTRWRPPRDRRQYGHSDRAAGLAFDGNVLRLPSYQLLGE